MSKRQCKNISNLAKDAQSNGDPVLAQNYLQHADHYLRRYNELNERKESSIETKTSKDKIINVFQLKESLSKRLINKLSKLS